MEFRPLHPDFGAEVIGFDVENGLDSADIAALREAYDRYSLLLFRGAGHLPNERHIELASWFGPPSPVDNTGKGDFVSVLHNRDPGGSMQLPFHCDLTYTDYPIKAICLQAIELPLSPTSTTYVSNLAAWKHLSPDMQQQLEGLTLEHVHISNVPEYDWPPFIAEHPVKFPHPSTGQPMLLCTEHHATRILELDEAESRALIDRLFAHQYAPERQYDHVWQLNDVLMFDNLAVQHARREKSDYAGGPRALQRVALCEITLQESIDRARAKQAA
ncbi:MAG: TauD/TfdA dioxygenase family protein [Novosphingobium sp.]